MERPCSSGWSVHVVVDGASNRKGKSIQGASNGKGGVFRSVQNEIHDKNSFDPDQSIYIPI